MFEYDYAPSSELIELRRVFLNVSQEGRDDVDDLVEGGLLNGLRVSTKDHQSTACYQARARALHTIERSLLMCWGSHGHLSVMRITQLHVLSNGHAA